MTIEPDLHDERTSARARAANPNGTASFLCALVGVCLVRLLISGTYRRYVKPSLGPYLAVSAGVLLVAAAVTWWLGRAQVRHDPGDHDGHDHDEHDHGGHDHDDHDHEHGRSIVGWFLVLPVLTVFLIAPPGLGSYALGRSAATVTAGRGSFDELQGPGPVDMLLKDFVDRAYDRQGASFVGVPVRLVGFVAPSPDGTGFLVARFQIACCAADGRAGVAHAIGFEGVVPPRDTWVEVVGSWEAGAGDQEAPLLRVQSLRSIPTPEDPYEPN